MVSAADNNNNNHTASHSNSSPSERNTEDEISKLDMYERSWFKDKGLLKLNFLLSIVMLSASTTGFDAGMMNGFQSLGKWETDFGNPEGALLGALSNGVYFGYFVSFLFAPLISDKFGRKTSIIVGDLTMIVGAIIQTFSVNYASFLISRIIVGAGNTIAVVGAVPLISESSYPTQREVMTGMYTTHWYSGAILSTWSILGTSFTGDSSLCWRAPSIIQITSPLIQLLFIWWIPESPRYLVSKCKIESARDMLLKFHGENNESKYGKLIDSELSEIFTAIDRERSQNTCSYTSLFKGKPNLHRLVIIITLAIIVQLSGTSVVTYYFKKILSNIGIDSKTEQLEIYGYLMIFSLAGCFCIPWIIKKLKRRDMLLWCLIAMLICMVIWTVLSAIDEKQDYKNKSLSIGVIAMIFIDFFCYNAGMISAPLYVSEILPFNLRSKGTSIYFMVVYVSQIFSGFVNPIAMDAISWKYYIVYCCWIGLDIAIVFFVYPETKGYSLEDISKVFGDNQSQDIDNRLKEEHRSISPGSEEDISPVKTKETDTNVRIEDLA